MSTEDDLEAAFDPRGHPTAVTVAGLDLDAFDALTTRRVESHIAGCTRCQGTVDGLVRASGSLADTPPYPQMPESVFDRLQSTIRAEQAQRTHTVTAPAPPSPGVVDLASERARRRRRTQWISAAAAGVVVIAAVGISLGVGSSKDEGGSGSFAGGPPASVVPSDQLPGSGKSEAPPTAAAYTRQNLSSHVADIVRHAGLTVPGLKVSPAGAMKNPQKRAACVAALGEKRKLVAVQQADFEGRLSFVFVFAPEGQAGPNVHVVGPACGSGTSDLRYSTRGNY